MFSSTHQRLSHAVDLLMAKPGMLASISIRLFVASFYFKSTSRIIILGYFPRPIIATTIGGLRNKRRGIEHAGLTGAFMWVTPGLAISHTRRMHGGLPPDRLFPQSIWLSYRWAYPAVLPPCYTGNVGEKCGPGCPPPRKLSGSSHLTKM